MLAVFDRTDAEIREEIMTQVITGHSEPSWYSVIVRGGVVTLEGNSETIPKSPDRHGFVVALHLMNSPATARRGSRLSWLGMMVAVAAALASVIHEARITTRLDVLITGAAGSSACGRDSRGAGAQPSAR